jgi:diguanylate cyclase (GGDEF)-like protein
MNYSSDQDNTIVDATQVLADAPFGVCLMDETEQVIWTNATLRNQLGLTVAEDSENRDQHTLSDRGHPENNAIADGGMYFDDLPITVEQNSGLCQPIRNPRLRLRMVVTPLYRGVRLATFTDVTDLTSGAEGYVDILREIVFTDSVTGLRNHAQIGRDLLSELNRSRRYGNDLSVIHVKIGGEYADAKNDSRTKVLRQVGVRLAGNLRAIDYVGQWSDNEFLVVLPETDADGAERLVAKLQGVLAEVTGDVLTTECGFAVYRASDDLHTLLDRAKHS